MIPFLMTRIDKIQNELSKLVSLHAQLTGQLAEAKYILEQYNNLKSESSPEIKQDDIKLGQNDVINIDEHGIKKETN